MSGTSLGVHNYQHFHKRMESILFLFPLLEGTFIWTSGLIRNLSSTFKRVHWPLTHSPYCTVCTLGKMLIIMNHPHWSQILGLGNFYGRKIFQKYHCLKLKIFNFKFFSDVKFVSANHILQSFFLRNIFLSGNGITNSSLGNIVKQQQHHCRFAVVTQMLAPVLSLRSVMTPYI